MTGKYNVSIIVPVYNREEIIEKCISSINLQSYDKAKWEVIFIDDASTDNSIKSIDSLIDKSINYRILKRPVGSGNASTPRNEGIKASLSKYVFFLDSDDYVDSQLLENGMAMALENNSDIVYVKVKAIGRHMTSKPFERGNIVNANPLENHLVRTLAPFKFVKRELLIKNTILFIPSIVKAEDQIFFIQALSKAKKVSILADKIYYIQQAHEGEHLSKAKHSLDSFMETIIIPLNSIFMSNIDKERKKMLYNAWLLRSTERIKDFTKKIKINDKKFMNMFELASSYFNIHRELFDLTQIWENQKVLTLYFLEGDFILFYRMVHKLNVLNNIHIRLKKELQHEVRLSAIWIYKNKVVVLDFILNNNKLAFDIEVDETKSLLKVWMFSRNMEKSLASFENEVISFEKNKYLISECTIDRAEEVTKIIFQYLEKIKLKNKILLK